MWAVLKKEFKTYFLSPIGYVFVGVFLAIFSLLFYITIIQQGVTTFQYLFYYSVMYSVIFVIPLLTMRTFSEERKNGTEQLLLTSPRSITEVTLGKFFGAVLVILIPIIFSFIYLGILCFFKTPDMATVLVSMFGFLLVSMAYISLGIFISSLTENQIIAAISTIAIFILTWISPNISSNLASISLIDKFLPFTEGKFTITETIIFVSITIMFIILTIIVMKRRKLVK